MSNLETIQCSLSILIWILICRWMVNYGCGPIKLDFVACETFVEHPEKAAVQSNIFALRSVVKPGNRKNS